MHAGKTPAYPLDKRRCATREAGKIVRFTAERLGAVVAAPPVWHESLQEMLPLRLHSGQAWPEGIGRIVAARGYPRNWSFTEASASIELLQHWTVRETHSWILKRVFVIRVYKDSIRQIETSKQIPS